MHFNSIQSEDARQQIDTSMSPIIIVKVMSRSGGRCHVHFGNNLVLVMSQFREQNPFPFQFLLLKSPHTVVMSRSLFLYSFVRVVKYVWDWLLIGGMSQTSSRCWFAIACFCVSVVSTPLSTCVMIIAQIYCHYN